MTTHYVTFATGITVEREGPDPKESAARAMLAALIHLRDKEIIGCNGRERIHAAIAQAKAAGISPDRAEG